MNDVPRRLMLFAAVLALLVSCGISGGTPEQHTDGSTSQEPEPGSARRTSASGLSRDDLEVLAKSVASTVAAGEPRPGPHSGRLGKQRGRPVFAAVRDGGRWLGGAWVDGPGPTALDVVAGAVTEAVADAGSAEKPHIDTAELCLSHSYRAVDLARDEDGLLTNVHVGVLGLELRQGRNIARYSPTLMLANNWDFYDVMEIFAEAYDLPLEDLSGAGVQARVFSCQELLVTLDGEPRAAPMFRGNGVVPMSFVNRHAVARLDRLMGDWLVNQVHPDGRVTYEYWPSRAEESPDNNMIRQWMATLALERLAARRGDRRIYRLAERNIRYNLDNFYVQSGRLGLIIEPADGDVKLGAVALAALALMEHPHRKAFAREEKALNRTVDSLWHRDGSFRTFFRPVGRNDNQNFYPGEALLLWANRYRETHDPRLLDRFMRSFRYYRKWHLDPDNRNPAFVPWHTMAYAMMWHETGDRRLLDFVFTMNDWLLRMQQWETAPYPDLRGRFYDPDRPEYGSPHASSTGVYLEGLVAAHRMAVAVGDDGRRKRYWRAIERGLRDVMQLQFTDDVDLYYVDDDVPVRGGIRTEVYDNVIRVDNVQHNLMAVMGVLPSWRDRK